LLKCKVAGSRRYRWLSKRPSGQLGNTPTHDISPQAARLVWRARRVRKTAKDVIDLNRVGGEAEFIDLNKEAFALANFGMKV